MNERKLLEIENAEVIFRNFSGEESDYNAAGSRNFAIKLAPNDADALRNDGWNIKTWDPGEGEEPVHYLPVSIRFNPFPPKVYMIPGNGKPVMLDESTIGLLDDAEFENVDISITPYNWQLKNGSSGIKAYVKEMYVTIRESRFAQKYNVYGD